MPEIYTEVKTGKRSLLIDGHTATAEQNRLLVQSKTKTAANLQQPSLFDFSRKQSKTALLALP